MRWALALPLLALGCSPCPKVAGVCALDPPCSVTVEGVCVVDMVATPEDPSLPPVSLELEDAPARIQAQLEASTAYWGGASNALDGWRVLYTDQLVDCEGADQGFDGCTYWDEHVIALYLANPWCFEESALTHEVGHVLLRDPGHTDPRWKGLPPVELAEMSSPNTGGVGRAARRRARRPRAPDLLRE